MLRILLLIFILIVVFRLYIYQKDNSRNPRGRKLDFTKVDLPFLSKRSAKRKAFLEATFGMLAYMAGADGKITQEELNALQELSRKKLKLPKEGQKRAVKFFKKAKVSGKPFSYYVGLMTQHFGSNKEVLVMQIYILLGLALADSTFAKKEREIINRAIEAFDLKSVRFRSPYLGGEVEFVYEPYLKLRSKREVVAAAKVTAAAAAATSKGEIKSSSSSLSAAYEILGCKLGDPVEKVDRAFRVLSKEFDPETLKSKGLPAEFDSVARAKLEELKGAYFEISGVEEG